MPTLSGQSIQNTYQGLLKLADSTTGITSSLQTVEDGLGNELPYKLSTTRIQLPNNYGFQPLPQTTYGTGFATTSAQQWAAGTQNIIISSPFIDRGVEAYSGMSYYVANVSSGDSVEVAFYTAQNGPLGLYPYQKVGDISTLTNFPSAQINTTTFSGGALSFSATGTGVYFLVIKINNSNIQPTVRFGIPAATFPVDAFSGAYLGYVPSFTTNVYNAAWRANVGKQVLTGTTTFDATYTYSTISSSQSTTANINGVFPGFLLHAIR